MNTYLQTVVMLFYVLIYYYTILENIAEAQEIQREEAYPSCNRVSLCNIHGLPGLQHLRRVKSDNY